MSSSSADTLPEALQSADLFDFPVPPSRSPRDSSCSSASTSDSESDAEELPASRPAAHVQCIPPPAEPAEPAGLGEPAEPAEHPALRFARVSRSTTSLPAFAHPDPGRFHARDGGSSTCSMPRPPAPFLQMRAAQSHHHLPYAKDSEPLSRSLMSLASRGEPGSEVVELLTPIEYESCEFIGASSSGSVVLLSHAHEPALLRPALVENEANCHQYEYQPPSTKQLTPLLPHSSEVSRPGTSHDERAAAVLPVRMSLAFDSPGNYRNSMVVGNLLFPGLDGGSLGQAAAAAAAERQEAAKPSRLVLDGELPGNIGARRASRYLYDVPGSPAGGGIQGTLSRAVQWSQRISQGPPHRLHRTRSSIVDQHKIYDIYEESIWHTAQTPIAPPGGDAKTGASRFHFGLGSAAALESLRPSSGRRGGPADSAAGGHGHGGGARAHVLRSVKSAGVPWNMIRSWKNRDTSGRKYADWDASSVSSDSSYSEVDGCSTLSDDESQDAKGPQRKPSAIHLLVKRAGNGLLRRSASFYRSISGTTLVGSATGSARHASHSQTASPTTAADRQAGSDAHRRTIGRRLASAMRLAGGKLRAPWRPSHASPVRADDASDIVSAYPADPSAEKALDSYLSMSSTHSPVLSAPPSAAKPAVAAYVPPKRPPYLGLHRHSVIDQDQPPAGPPHPVAPAQLRGGPAPMRSTQFKSPFTTLPYGTYHQTMC
ncbi:hypothetical protein H4R21_004450 [Coemansia helicoidea]|uniref:Uncharacterized protein n=1 Tax=Coemansia helicoidea TaxID=1286919 RepID=A0ACC1KYK8_9FUNG|nr:hypothetical protein H4R21_004450 [Coemansia helicoidea]